MVDPIMSRLSSHNQPEIGYQIIVSCFIRWVSGGLYLDIRTAAGISISSFYRVMIRCARAIIRCPALAYSFPPSTEQIRKAAEEFKKISTNNFITGCVGVMV
jgi:hypothetical protein